jgi:hypothetical protein
MKIKILVYQGTMGKNHLAQILPCIIVQANLLPVQTGKDGIKNKHQDNKGRNTMKKLKLLTAIAVAGVVGMSVHAANPSGFETINIKLTALAQNGDNTQKIKITNKDLLNQIAQEFDESSVTNKGAKIALGSGGFFDGDFFVLDQNNTEILDASDELNPDDYHLFFDWDTVVFSEKSDKESSTAVAFFEFENANGSVSVDLNGLAKVNDTFKNDSESESLKFTGSGNGEDSGDAAVVSGSISGSGKGLSDIGF